MFAEEMKRERKKTEGIERKERRDEEKEKERTSSSSIEEKDECFNFSLLALKTPKFEKFFKLKMFEMTFKLLPFQKKFIIAQCVKLLPVISVSSINKWNEAICSRFENVKEYFIEKVWKNSKIQRERKREREE